MPDTRAVSGQKSHPAAAAGTTSIPMRTFCHVPTHPSGTPGEGRLYRRAPTRHDAGILQLEREGVQHGCHRMRKRFEGGDIGVA